MSPFLFGDHALVTGASRGIGAATAELLARRGAAVSLLARTLPASESVVAAIEAAGGRARAFACDIADADAVGRTIAAARDVVGPVDILVNNAGVVDPIGRIETLDPADFDAAVRVNLNGAFYALRAVLPQMQGRGRGTIVNVSSGAAHRPLEGWVSYCAAKAGLHMLTLAVALENADSGIRVFGFKPGTVDTEMQAVIRASGINPVSRMTRDQHRPPAVPAEFIAYLCTAAADDLAGRELDIADPDLQRRVSRAR